MSSTSSISSYNSLSFESSNYKARHKDSSASNSESVEQVAQEVLSQMPLLEVIEPDKVTDAVTLGISAEKSPIALKTFDFSEGFRIGLEAKALSDCVGAPHCVKVRDPYIGEYNGKFAIPMNSAGANDLSSFCEGKDLKIDNLSLIGEQVLEFLDHLNGELNLGHCDIKPGNIGLETPFISRVIDLGYVTKLNNSTKDFGTFGYTHPEMLFGCPVKHSYDLFSLAATLLKAYIGDSFSPNVFNEDYIADVMEGFFQSLESESLAEFNELDERGKRILAQIYISMHDYQSILGRFFPSFIYSIVQNDGNLIAFDTIFQCDEDNKTYKLRKLKGVNLPRFDWRQKIKERSSFLNEEEKAQSLIKVIESLSTVSLQSPDVSAANFLGNPFFSRSIHIKLNIDDSYLKKDYELLIINPKDRTNHLNINLNRKKEDIEEECYHLLSDGSYHIEVRSKKNPSEVVFEIDEYEITDKALIQIS